MTITAEKIEAIRTALRDHPGEMTMQLAKRLDVPEAEVIRRLPDGRSVELDLARWQELFTAFEAVGSVLWADYCWRAWPELPPCST